MSQPPSLPRLNDLIPAVEDTETLVTRVTYKIFMILVTLLALILMAVFYLTPLPNHAREVLYLVNFINSGILLFDFGVRFRYAPSKWRYFFPHGLLDLIGSLPGFPILRLCRLPWLFSTLRDLRHTTRRDILDTARSRLAESTLLSGIIVVFLVVTVGGTAIVWVEAPAPGSNIKSGGDALWYAIVTISTVGYGDLHPITFPGRLIGSVMIFVGVGIFSVLTGYISTQFLAKRKRAGAQADTEHLQRHMESLFEQHRRQAAADRAALEQQIADLRRQLAEQEPAQRPPP
jgi:voltage-gated potassium channel